jgi:hypothetical protein
MMLCHRRTITFFTLRILCQECHYQSGLTISICFSYLIRNINPRPALPCALEDSLVLLLEKTGPLNVRDLPI